MRLALLISFLFASELLLGWGAVTSRAEAAPSGEEVGDFERLLGGAPPAARLKLIIYPLDDQSLLDDEAVDERERARLGERGRQAWERFVQVLGEYPNLDLETPERLRHRLRRGERYQRLFGVASELRRRGEQAYRDVELEQSIELFSSSLKILTELSYRETDPKDLARLYLQRGIASLEIERLTAAEADFQRALRHDPGLRLRPGFDGARTLEAFARALEARRARSIEPWTPQDLSLPAGNYRIYGVLRDATLLITFQRPEGLSFERLELGRDDPAESGDRLARRIWGCLPFQLNQQGVESELPKLYMQGAFRYFAFTRSPVAIFSHFAFHGGLAWHLSPRLIVEIDSAWGNSNRDEQATLRDELRTVRSGVGLAYQLLQSTPRLQLSLGLELTHLSAVRLSSVVGCKHFSEDDLPPPAICDFDADIRQEDPSWHLGPATRLSLQLPIAKGAEITLAFDAAAYIYDSGYDRLGIPLGGWLGVRYALF